MPISSVGDDSKRLQGKARWVAVRAREGGGRAKARVRRLSEGGVYE